MRFVMFVVLIILGSSCATVRVKPWERGTLSTKEMQFGVNVLEEGFDDHTYFSKEGSSGGRGFSAGGCGCN